MLADISFFGISLYFIIISLSLCLIIPALLKRAEKLSLSKTFSLDLYMVVLVGSFFGARLFYVLYQEPRFYFTKPLEILYFWNGGFIFYGGLIGGALAHILFCKVKKESVLLWLNFSAPLLSLGYGLGRLACFLNGCCYGAKAEIPWSVFMHEAWRHPTQLYAAATAFLNYFICVYFIEKKFGFKKFYTLPTWMLIHGLGRIFMEHYRDDPRGADFLGLSISTFISLVLVGMSVILFFFKNINVTRSKH